MKIHYYNLKIEKLLLLTLEMFRLEKLYNKLFIINMNSIEHKR